MAATPGDYQRGFDDRVAPLVRDAAERSPGFAARLDGAGVSSDDLTDVATLDRLPILTKDDLLTRQLADPPFGGLLAPGVAPRRVFQSPGPLYEPQVGDGDRWRWAPALRAAGFGSGDVVLIAFGFHLSPAGAMFEAACHDLGATVVPAGTGNKDLQARACADLGVTAYIGPPSYLKALLEAADHDRAELSIARAFVSAEPLPPSLRAWLSDRVAVVRQGYGTAEAGNLGWECAREDGLHVPADALVQVCDLTTGAARHDGGDGQVVVTLFEPDYPIVRLGTGDLSAWADQPCDCGTPTPRIRGWLGRVGDAVKVKGMFLHPRQVDAVMARLDRVAAYRVVVDRIAHKDVLRCEVVAAPGADGDITTEVEEAMRDGLRFTAAVELVRDLPDGMPRFEDIRTWE